MVSSTVLAAGAGGLGAVALGAGQASGPPLTTTTISVAAGPAGPAGPPGPPGPAGTGGAEQCPAGSTFQAVQVNHPGGHITLWVCVAT
jgi:hypothetical protein